MVLQGKAASVALDSADFPDVATLKVRWEIERTAWFDFVDSLSRESTQTERNMWQTIMHVVMHGIQHRSEAAYILTGYGYSPGDLDFDVFLQEIAA